MHIYFKIEDETTWMEMDIFPLIYTTIPTKINIIFIFVIILSAITSNIFSLIQLFGLCTNYFSKLFNVLIYVYNEQLLYVN